MLKALSLEHGDVLILKGQYCLLYNLATEHLKVICVDTRWMFSTGQPHTGRTRTNWGCLAFLTDDLPRCTHVPTVGFLKAGPWRAKKGLRPQTRNEHRSGKETDSCFQANWPWSSSNPEGKLGCTSTVMSHFEITRSNTWHRESTEPNRLMKASRVGVEVLGRRGSAHPCAWLWLSPLPLWLPVNLLTNDCQPEPKSWSTHHPHNPFVCIFKSCFIELTYHLNHLL